MKTCCIYIFLRKHSFHLIVSHTLSFLPTHPSNGSLIYAPRKRVMHTPSRLSFIVSLSHSIISHLSFSVCLFVCFFLYLIIPFALRNPGNKISLSLVLCFCFCLLSFSCSQFAHIHFFLSTSASTNSRREGLSREAGKEP